MLTTLFNSPSRSTTALEPEMQSLFTPDPTPPPPGPLPRARLSHVEVPRYSRAALREYKPMKESKPDSSPKKRTLTSYKSSPRSFRQVLSPELLSHSLPPQRIVPAPSQPRSQPRTRPRAYSTSTRQSSPEIPLTISHHKPSAKASTSLSTRNNGPQARLSVEEAITASLAHNATLGSLSPVPAVRRSSSKIKNGGSGPSKGLTKSTSAAGGVKRKLTKATEEEGAKKKKQKVIADEEPYSPSKLLGDKREPQQRKRQSPRKAQKSPQRQPLSNNLLASSTLSQRQLSETAFVQLDEEEELLKLYFDIVPLIEEEVIDGNLTHLKTDVGMKAGVEITYHPPKGKEKEGDSKVSQGPVETWFAKLQNQRPLSRGQGFRNDADISIGPRVWAWYDHPLSVRPRWNDGQPSQDVDELEDDPFNSTSPTKSKSKHKRRRSGGLPGDSAEVPIVMDEDDAGDGVGGSPSKIPRPRPKTKERTKERSPVKTVVNGAVGMGTGSFSGVDRGLACMEVQTSDDFLAVPSEQGPSALDLNPAYHSIMSSDLLDDATTRMLVDQMEDFAPGAEMDLTTNYPGLLDDVGLSMNTLGDNYDVYGIAASSPLIKNALRPHAPADAGLFPSPHPHTPTFDLNRASKDIISPDDPNGAHAYPWTLHAHGQLLSPTSHSQAQLFGNGTIDPSLLLSEQDHIQDQAQVEGRDPSPSPVIRRVQHDHEAGIVTIRSAGNDSYKGKEVVRVGGAGDETKPDGMIGGRTKRVRRPSKKYPDMVASTTLRLSGSPFSPSLSPSLGEASSRPAKRSLPPDISPIVIPDGDSEYAALMPTRWHYSASRKRQRSPSVPSYSPTVSSTSATSSLRTGSRAMSNPRQSNNIAKGNGVEEDEDGKDFTAMKYHDITPKGPGGPSKKPLTQITKPVSAVASTSKLKAKPTKTATGAGVRKGRKGVEWPMVEEAFFCHHCRTRSFKQSFVCASCPKRYCCRCLALKYDPPIHPDPTSLIWNCPACDDACTCDICTRRRGEVYVSFRTGKPASPPPSWVPPKAKEKEATVELEEIWVPSPDLNELGKVPVKGPLTYWAVIYGLDGEAMGKAYRQGDQQGDKEELVALPLNGEASFRKPNDHCVEVPVKRTSSSRRDITATPAPPKTRRRVYVGEVPPCWKFSPSIQTAEINPAPKADKKSWNQRNYIGNKEVLFMKCKLNDEDYRDDEDTDAEGETDAEELEDDDGAAHWNEHGINRIGPPGVHRTKSISGLGNEPMSPLTDLGDGEFSSLPHQTPAADGVPALLELRTSVPILTPPVAADNPLPIGISPVDSLGPSFATVSLGSDEFASLPSTGSGSATAVGDSPIENPSQCVPEVGCAIVVVESNGPTDESIGVGSPNGSDVVLASVLAMACEAAQVPYRVAV
ncbi:hypothetical protein BDN72DRAFT_173026 [Pluteus cervinus]|uniref:Uncharacterized protein n=1 Tax=Pluteus cervinus TaxID=181527 RepID=A0ACD3AJM1_9AGAR|nr:hypothetical protein BDN72DRAFT_173026 [Pluteus cervinus]